MDGQMPFLQPLGYDEGDKGQPPTNLPPRREAFFRSSPWRESRSKASARD